jgi:hypothetical protein
LAFSQSAWAAFTGSIRNDRALAQTQLTAGPGSRPRTDRKGLGRLSRALAAGNTVLWAAGGLQLFPAASPR